ncbi:putative transcriptional regulator, ArsR family [Candidatus Methanophagaceae archaeon]|nr:putative transcriptional regulator, ArsR family [Methanophagales archaeon]
MDGIETKILKFLIEEDWPVTTEMVAKEVGIAWNTAQVHLWKLVSQGLVKGKRVGRQNQGMATDQGKEHLIPSS